MPSSLASSTTIISSTGDDWLSTDSIARITTFSERKAGITAVTLEFLGDFT
ncbi:MAG: hypothetical protein ACO24N_07240 [Ilumatobacteraceae bacterium]